MSIRSLWLRWVDTWSQVGDASTFVLVRTLFAAVILLEGLTLIPDAGLLFGGDGLNPDPIYKHRQYLTPFRWVDHELVLYGSLGVMIIAAALAVVGRSVRVMVPLAALIHLGLHDHAWAWSFGAHNVLQLWTLIIGGACVLTPTRYLGAWPGRAGAAGIAPMWPLWLMRLQVATIYFVTAAEKIRGEEWRDGSAVFHALDLEYLERFPAPAFFVDSELLVRLATWGTLAIEFGLAFLLFHPRTRRLAIVLAAVMHLGFEVFLDLGFFGPAMVVGVFAFLSPSDARRLMRPSTWRRQGERSTLPETAART